MSDLTRAVQHLAQAAITREIESPTIPIEAPRMPGLAAAETAQLVSDAIAPVIAHATNTEPWYQSRVTWGAILTLSGPVLGLLGVSLAPEDKEAIITAALAVPVVIGPLLTLYGRWRATKPIGA